MSILIKGYHGYLTPKLAKEMDAIAMPITPNIEWEFEGSVGDFAEKWGHMFMAIPDVEATKTHTAHYQIYVTQHNSWGAR
jgi:hypothetical protein